MEQELIRDKVKENRILEKKLTKRNEQYIFDLKKVLNANGFSEEETINEMHQILPILVNEQKTGQTARQLFGTVSERAALIVNKPKKHNESSPFQMWLDNSLLLFVFLTFMAGILPLVSRETAKSQNQGLLTILIASISGGYAFYLIYKYVYRFDKPGVDQSDRPGALKSMFIMISVLLTWMVVFMISGLIPTSINLTFSSIVYLPLAGLAFIIRYYLKKKYHIKGSILTR